MPAALASSVFALTLVQLCTGLVRRRCGSRVAYACWLLPCLSLAACLPPGGLVLPDDAACVIVRHWIDDVPDATLIETVWGGIAILFFSVHLAYSQRFFALACRDATHMPNQGVIRVLRSPNIVVPAAAGVLRRRILLPERFEQSFSADERALILRHEQAHHERGDILANLLALALLSLHWWNPLAYSAHRRFRADQELACDETATAGLDPSARHAYGMAILKCAAAPPTGLAVAMAGRNGASERISAIVAGAAPSPRRPLPAIAAASALSIITLLAGVTAHDLGARSHVTARLAEIPATPSMTVLVTDQPGADASHERPHHALWTVPDQSGRAGRWSMSPAVLRVTLPPDD